MRVTKPMIERGVAAFLAFLENGEEQTPSDLVEQILKAALEGDGRPREPIPGETRLDDFLPLNGDGSQRAGV